MGTKERTDQAPTEGQPLGFHASLQLGRPGQVPVRIAFQNFVVTGYRLVKLRHCRNINRFY
jgi:hypothetical protein